MSFKKGDKVKFVSADDDQVKWGSNDDPRKVLNTEDVYEVETVEVHSWHTKLYLKGIKGKFNSVSFEKVNETSEISTRSTSRIVTDSIVQRENYFIVKAELQIEAKCPKCGRYIDVIRHLPRTSESAKDLITEIFTDRYTCYCGHSGFLTNNKNY